MKNKRIVLFLSVLLLWLITLACVDPFAALEATEQAQIPDWVKEQERIQSTPIVLYPTPNLTGFNRVEGSGLVWDCSDSEAVHGGEKKQFITAVGDNLLFICQNNIPYYKFVEQTIKNPPGQHDSGE